MPAYPAIRQFISFSFFAAPFFLLPFGRSALFFFEKEEVDDHGTHSDGEENICHVEYREINEIESEHIHHIAETHAVNEVAQSPRQDEGEADTGQNAPLRQVMEGVDQIPHHQDGDDEEEAHPPLQYPPGGPTVLDEVQGKNIWDNFQLIVQGEILDDSPLH